MKPEDAARKIFGERAAMYATSATHTDAAVLARVVELAAPHRSWSALDLATGSGHTAFAVAPYLGRVIGLDLTPEMLAEARRLRSDRAISNVEFQVGDVHRLPFRDGAFDLVTSRRAPHHFSRILRALSEMVRVLRPGGRLVIDDRSVPEDDFIDGCMNQLDGWHDESHVRQYRPSEWVRMLESIGFTLDHVEPYTKHRPLTSLTDGVAPENVRKVHAAIAALTPAQRDAMNVREVQGQIHSNHWYVLLAAHSIPVTPDRGPSVVRAE